MKRKRISNNVIKRLPLYLRKLDDLICSGSERISSNELGEQMGLTPSQIRQDFSCFGEFGQQGYGYRVSELREQVAKILGMNETFSVIIVGAGNLGHALITNFGFEKQGFNLIAAFDSNPNIIGSSIGGILILDSQTLFEWIADNPIDIVVLTVPSTVAKEIASKVAECGVKGIWNFSDIELDLDSRNVSVENIHFSDSLLNLSYALNEAKNETNKI